MPLYTEAYKGVINQLNKKCPGYITFVSHAGTDLMNGLASAAIGIPGDFVQYVQLVDDFKDEWKDAPDEVIDLVMELPPVDNPIVSASIEE